MLGHRGASAHATENTLGASRVPAPTVPTASSWTFCCVASGEVVVFHDDDLARLAGRPARIDATPYQPLARERASGRRADSRLLAEALAVMGPDLMVNVELKASAA